MKVAGGLDVNRDGGGSGEVGEIAGGEALLGATVGGVLNNGDGKVDFAGTVVGGRGDGIQAGSDLVEEAGELGRVEFHARGVVEDVDDVTVKHVLIKFFLVGAEGLKLVASGTGGLVGDGFDELFADPVEDGGGGENFAEGGVAGQAEFLEKLVDEAVGVARDHAKRVSAGVGGARGAELDDNVAGVLGGA